MASGRGGGPNPDGRPRPVIIIRPRGATARRSRSSCCNVEGRCALRSASGDCETQRFQAFLPDPVGRALLVSPRESQALISCVASPYRYAVLHMRKSLEYNQRLPDRGALALGGGSSEMTDHLRPPDRVGKCRTCHEQAATTSLFLGEPVTLRDVSCEYQAD